MSDVREVTYHREVDCRVYYVKVNLYTVMKVVIEAEIGQVRYL